jgi:hypothetical protein
MHFTCSLFVWLISHQPAVLFSQNKPATSNQPAVLFSQNKPAPAINHQPTEQAGVFTVLVMFFPVFKGALEVGSCAARKATLPDSCWFPALQVCSYPSRF